MPVGGRKLVIAPVLAGAGGKMFSAIEAVVGVIILAVAWWNPLGWAAGGALMAAAVGTGVSLTLGGITGLLTTVPKANSAAAGGDSLSSFYFNGAANTQQQGAPVTLVYGRMLVGSTAISASLQAIDMSQAPAETGNLS
jgi:predicted phage tail protein